MRPVTGVEQIFPDVDELIAELQAVGAPRLTFLDGATRTRRDHPKYLALIRAVALLHQHQREVKVREIEGEREEYLEATLADVEAANRLADEVLGRSLDELPPQTRRLLELVDQWVRGECERLQIERSALLFGRRQLSDALGLFPETPEFCSRKTDCAEAAECNRKPCPQRRYGFSREHRCRLCHACCTACANAQKGCKLRTDWMESEKKVCAANCDLHVCGLGE